MKRPHRVGRKRTHALLAAIAASLALWFFFTADGPAPPPTAAPEPATPVQAPVPPPPGAVPAPPPAAPAPEVKAPPPAPAVNASPAPAFEPPRYGYCDPPGTQPSWTEHLFISGRLQSAAMRASKERWSALAARGSAAAIAELERAHAATPDDDFLTLTLGDLLSDTPRLADARAAYAGYLRRHPGDRFVAQRYARLETQLEIQGGYALAEARGVTVWYPRGAITDARAWAAADDVRRAIDEAATLTRTVPRDTLTVVIYPGASELLAVSCVPAWTGGLFDGTLRLVAKDGALGRTTLRHESLHAQVSPLMQRQPRWFSEGLAEYFANPDRPRLSKSLGLLVRNQTRIPFSSMHGSFFVFEGPEANLAYAQSDAMVRWLVAARGSPALADAVAWFKGGGGSEGLFGTLDPTGGLNEPAFAAWLHSQQW